MPPSKSSGPFLAIVIPAVAVAVTGVGLWVWSGSGSSTPHAGTPTTTLPSSEPPPTDAPEEQRGAGIFTRPGRADHARRTASAEPGEDEDMPLPGEMPKQRGGNKHLGTHRKRGADGQPARPADPHTIFESDPAEPYASGEQKTLDGVKVNPDAGTVSFWIQPAWAGRLQDDASLVEFGDGIIRIIKNVSFLRYEVIDTNGGSTGLGAPLSTWQPGEWHQIVATWDGRTIYLYVDGGLISTAAQTGPIAVTPDTPVHVGSSYPLGRPVAPAVLAFVSIRDRALTPTAVARRFENGPRPEE